jgi:gliding motility-associated-like protein
MKAKWSFSVIILIFIGLPIVVFSQQPGEITEAGDSVLDPNGDGYVSIDDTGFLGDGYDPDEFEIKMFGVPIFGDGEALADNANGPDCGVSDLALDSAGYAIYAGYDSLANLIFRMRLGGDNSSVQSYTMFIDTDQAIGPEDPNSTSENPGFEIEITYIVNFGIFVFDVDGIDSCPSPIRQYDVSSHRQKSVSSNLSCNDADYFLDFYVPFTDLEADFGINEDTQLRFVGVTNISRTCALDGALSDIGGVDDTNYDGCFVCAMLDLTENQCPSGVSNLCETCFGFPEGVTETPDINKPVLVGDLTIDGTSEPEAFIYISVFSSDDNLFDQDSVQSDINGNWLSTDFNRALDFGDSIVVNALLPGSCQSGLNDAGLSFAIVSPNQPPEINGSQITLGYEENSPPILISEDIEVLDDGDNLTEATVSISANYIKDTDFLEADPSGGITAFFDPETGTLSLEGEAPILNYTNVLRTVSFYNTNENPNLNIRTITFQANDGVNLSPTFNKNLLITALNDPPVIIDTNDSILVETNEEVPIEICLVATDIDSDQFELTSIEIKNGSGEVDFTSGLCIVYSPNIDFNGMEYITVTLCDIEANSLCDFTVISIDVLPVNDPPVIVDPGTDPTVAIDSTGFKLEKDTQLSFCLDGFDPDGDNIDVSEIIFQEPNNSTLIHNGGLCFDFNPEPGFVGLQTVQITICDDGEPQSCIIFKVTFEIVAVNSAPLITDTNGSIFIETFKNIPVNICIPAVDPDNDELAIVTVENDLEGEIIISQNPLCLDYTPSLNFTGQKQFTVTVCDNVTPALCDITILEVTVIPTNNPPVINTVYFETTVNTVLDFCLDVLDPDNDDVALTSISIEGISGSTVSITDDLCAQFQPFTDFVGVEMISVELCDNGIPQACITELIEIEVFPTNRPPEILNEGLEVDTLYFTSAQDTPFQFCLEVTDLENNEVKIEQITTVQQGGFYQPTEEELCIEFFPESGFTGKDIHVITVCDDGDPTGCDVVVVNIEILPVNLPPEILLSGTSVDSLFFTTVPNLPFEFCLEAVDPDNDVIQIDSEQSFPQHGEITETGTDLCLSYLPEENYLGEDVFILRLCDDRFPNPCDEVVITINIESDNSAPRFLLNSNAVDSLLIDALENELVSLIIDIEDDNNDNLQIKSASQLTGSGLLFAEIQDSFVFEYTPDIGSAGLHRINFEICDDGIPELCEFLSIGINVFAANLAPIAENDSLEVEGNVLVTNILANDSDPDGDSIYINTALLELPDAGILEVTETGDLSFEPYPDFFGDVNFEYVVCDVRPDQLCSIATVIIEVPPKERVIVAFEAVSPNGDGLNDFWMIKDIIYFQNNTVRVFDRWNNLVYEANGYNNDGISWDGHPNKGPSKKMLPDGTYFYTIDPGDGSKGLKGKVVLKK